MIRIAALAAAFAVAAPAMAVTAVNGSLAVSVVGVSADQPTIGVGTTFTNTLFAVVGAATGDLAPVVGEFLTLQPVTASVGSVISFTSVFGNFSGTVQTVDADGPVTSRDLSLFVLGDFSPLGALSSFIPGPASLTFAFTQTGGPGSAVSGSFTFASPPVDNPIVPEPATWAMMIAGFGMVGGALRRRRITTVSA